MVERVFNTLDTINTGWEQPTHIALEILSLP
jgi:hypothetical protein